MNDMLILHTLVVLEVVAVEFLAIWKLSTRKHSFWASLGLYAVITAALIVLMYVYISKTPMFGKGSGVFMAMGVLYFVPALISYGGSRRTRLTIAFYAFSYGLAGFGVSIRLAYLFPAEYFTVSAFVTQTLFFLITWPIFIRYSKRYIIPTLCRADSKQKNLLVRYAITSFFLIIFFNTLATVETKSLLKLGVYLLLIYFVILSYRLLNSYLNAANAQQELRRQMHTDELTGLENRQALYEEMEQLIQNGTPFSLLFLDLDRFKTVNDTYGHRAGDDYLCAFADALRTLSSPHARFYHISGDEFAGLTTEHELPKRIRKLQPTLPQGIRYLGVSVGEASCPIDGTSPDTLMERADQNMYSMKKHKAPNRPWREARGEA